MALNNPIDAFIDGANFGTIAERVTVSGIDADAVVTLVTHPYQFKNTWNIMTYTDSMSPVNSQQIHYVNATTDSYDFGTDGSGQAYIVRAPGATNTTTYLAAGGTISASGSQATITGLTQDVTAYADGRNYSWYVNWLENGEASGTTSYLKTGETSATYSILARSGVKWIYQGNAVTGGSATVDGKTNTSITVTPTSDATVNVLTAAATNTYTYYIGDMAFELYANSQNYTFDGTTHTWTPASSSYKWRAASGTQSVTYEGDRYSVNNGTIKLINKSNQVVDMTVTLTNTATDSNVTGGQLIFTAPDGTTWNGTRTITMQPGRVMTITVGIDESSLDPNEIARTLDNVTFGTITVTAAVSDSAER